MIDPKKAEEISKKIQELSRQIQTRDSNITRIEREKTDKARYYDQQIQREQEEKKRLEKQVDDLKRQL